MTDFSFSKDQPGDGEERQIMADTRGMEGDGPSDPPLVPELMPEPPPEPITEADAPTIGVPELTTDGPPSPAPSPVEAAIREAEAADKGSSLPAPQIFLEVGGRRYLCIPKPPGHASATVSRLTGSVAAATMGKTPKQVMARAKKDPDFLMTISTAPGELADIAKSLIVDEHIDFFLERWEGRRGVPHEEFITEGDLMPALLDLFARYAKATTPLPSASTGT